MEFSQVEPRARQKLVVVLGMHRSGTSAIARGLIVAGASLGDRLLPAIKGVNDKGFWEDVDVYTLNLEMLKSLQGDWHHLSAINAEHVLTLHERGFFERAVELLRKKLSVYQVYGLKEPRITKLLPFWNEVFRHCTFDVSYLIAIRNPLSVVQSLKERDGFLAEKTYLLWLGHAIASLSGSGAGKRLVVSYEQLMRAPEEQLGRVAERFGLSLDQDELRLYESEFLDSSLQHSVFDLDDLPLDGACPPLVREVYATLLDLASDRVQIDDPAIARKIEGWSRKFAELEAAMRLVDAYEGRLAAANGALGERDERISKISKINSELDVQVASLKQAVAERDAQLIDSGARADVLLHALGESRLVIEGIYASNTWKLTAPLRGIRRTLVSRPLAGARNLYGFRLRHAWQAVPIAQKWKNRVKAVFFKAMPFVFSSTKVYRDWKNFTAPTEPNQYDDVGVDPAQVFSGLRSPSYVPLREVQPPLFPPVRLIAFYLPQFHAIPENDQWWGEGFTEWTNVRRARPIFAGHYQPRIPDELGYYNLLDPQVQKRQVELAKHYGIGGFCFYHYWFNGKRLLERPVENYLASPELDLPFCLCWANENWSRRWDGLDRELLISQHHSPQDDLDFITCVGRFLKDPRNIRIDGKPLLLVYRPKLLPSARDTARRWRRWCRDNGIGEIYLAYTQSFDDTDPEDIGFDAAVEFPPNRSYAPDVSEGAKPLDGELTCSIFDWDVFLRRSRAYKSPGYKLFRSVCPSWDNTARRRRGGTVFLNNTPSKYGQWLRNAIDDTCRRFSDPEERLVFVNAWNEWAEGAYLEPDRGYGYAFLQAGRDALLDRASVRPDRSLVLVVHDAHPHGAQFLALGMLRTLVEQFGYRVCTVVLGDGRLLRDFEKLSTACHLVEKVAGEDALRQLAQGIFAEGYRQAIINSTASGGFGSHLAEAGIDCVTLVHELAGVIRAHRLQEKAQAAARTSRCVVFPAQSVADAFAGFASLPVDRQRIRPQGLWRRNYWRFRPAEARASVRQRLGVPDAALLVLTVGYADLRKGVDLFVQVGLQILEQRPDAHFVWIGHSELALQPSIEDALARSGKGAAFHFLGFEPNTAVFHAAADVYALTSREDPFPNVVLESFDAGVPVVAFADSGGGAELAGRVGGRVVPHGDTAAFAGAVLQIAADAQLAVGLHQAATAEVDRHYAFRAYLFDLLGYLGTVPPRVSVVVPNFNYARHIIARLRSIVAQTVPIFELIILDDASSDDSVTRICAWLEENGIEAQIVVNAVNSGCVARQWAKGVALARGDYVWIAEADDLCNPHLLRTLLAPFDDPALVLSYCESRQIDEDGTLIAPNYADYLKDISATRWRQAYVHDGRDEILDALAIKNTIPNVSAVLFRRTALAEVLSEHLEVIAGYRQAADWYVYLEVLARGKVAFSPENCNSHRRHSASVIGGTGKKALLGEIRGVQDMAALRHAPLPERTATIARQYLEVLKKQFGLDEHAEAVE